MSPLVPAAKLTTTGAMMPLVGMGLWKVAGKDASDAVYNAIKIGYRLFDGACDYGNEKQCGEGVARAIKEGLVKREDLFITSKLWNTFHAQQHVENACRRSLSDWRLDYFDLYLIHFPIALKYVDPAERYPPEWFVDGKSKIETENSPINLTWAEMEKLPGLGLTRNIGVSNFSGSLMMDLMTYAKIPPAVLQIEMHPFFLQQNIHELCDAFDVRITAYCTFGPQSWIELNVPRSEQIPSLFEQEPVLTAAKAHGKSAGQVLLRFMTQRNIAVIPKSVNTGRLAENLDCSDFDLTEAEMSAIKGLDRGFRISDPHGFSPRHASAFVAISSMLSSAYALARWRLNIA